MRVYLDNCCYNRPFDDQSQLRIKLEALAKMQVQEEIELSAKCLDILAHSVGPVETERFVAYINGGRMDYTKWQRNLFKDMTIDEIAEAGRIAGLAAREALRQPTSMESSPSAV